MSKLTKEIRERLGQYLTGDLAPAEFRDWFALALRDVHKANDPGAEDLLHSIEWNFFDLERGILSEQVLKQNLFHLALSGTSVTGKVMTIGSMSCGWTSGASATLQVGTSKVASQAWMQILREKEYA